jgi:hypothetical protein
MCERYVYICYTQRRQLLEAIGAVSATDAKKALSHGGNYQECVAAPLTQVADDLAVLQDEVDDRDNNVLEKSDHIHFSVEKVNKLNCSPCLC